MLKEDSVLFYTDAIFGAKYDTLVIDKEKSIDSTFVFKNFPHKLRFKGGTDDDGKAYKYLHGDGYYIFMIIEDNNYIAGSQKIDYKNKDVPFNPYYYLDGKYTGQLEFKNQMYELFSMMSMGSINVSVEFIDDKTAKIYSGMIWGGGEKIVPYTVEGDRVKVGNAQKGAGGKIATEGFEIKSKGNVLHIENKEIILKLRKNSLY